MLYGGARGGGKTDGMIGDWLAHWSEHRNHARGLLVRRSYDELDEVKARLEEIMPAIGATWHGGRKIWVMPGGSFAGGALKLRFLAKDADAARYQGHSYTWVCVDEAGNFPSPDPIDKLRATLRSPHGVPAKLRITANPGGPGQAWVKQRYIDPARPFSPHYDDTTETLRVFIPSKLSDNPILDRMDPSYRRRLRSSGPAWLVQAWLEGDWYASPEGGIIKSAWFHRYTTAPAHKKIRTQSWDTAYKAQDHNDPSVCTTWDTCRTGHYLRDEWRDRVTYPGLKHALKASAEKWQPDAILVEDKASGQSLIQELKSETRLPIIAIEPEGDKVTRAIATSAMWEAGTVFLPDSAPWLLDLEIELTTFPQSPHDDRVDSITQFLRWVQGHGAAFDYASSGTGERQDGTHDVDTGWGRVRSTRDMRGY